MVFLDKLTKEQRSKNMQAVKNKDSKIELLLRNALWEKGIGYRKNYTKLIGKPDIVLTKYRIAIFVDSEFWHGFDWENRKYDIKSNKEFWINKIENNINRDILVTNQLKSDGWIVLRFWGKEITDNLEQCIKDIEVAIRSRYKKMKKYSTISKELSYIFEEEANYKKAVITHFFQTKEQLSIFNYYYNKAKEFISDKELENLLNSFEWDVPFLPVKNPKFTFIDLFAGIGGMRLAFQNIGGKCVFSSEWDKYAQITYEKNFGEVPFGDITKIDEKDIPEHDILIAGFPCQAFSIAGRRGGFDDTRGTLFFDVARILKKKRPKAFFLENVKGLINHDKGKTLKVILNTLRDDLDYYIPEPKIINAKDFGVPQNRERIFIVGFNKDLKVNEFKYPNPLKKEVNINDIMEDKPVSVKYYLSTQYLNTLEEHKKRHEMKGNGFGYEIISKDGIANAIVVGGMGRERNLIIDSRLTDFTPVTHIKGVVNRDGIRRMTPREWARLQGFPDEFIIDVSDAQAYKQFGNSVAVPAVQATAKEVVKKILRSY